MHQETQKEGRERDNAAGTAAAAAAAAVVVFAVARCVVVYQVYQ